MDHVITIRPGVGTVARIVQSRHLRFSRVTTTSPVLIVVKFGRKELRAPGFQCVLGPGDAVAISQDQVFDIVNTPGPDGQYQADWLVWDPVLISGFVSDNANSTIIDIAQDLKQVPDEFSHSFAVALDAVRQPDNIPHAIAVHRLNEVLVWIDSFGVRFGQRQSSRTSALVRRLILSSPDANWTASAIVSTIAMSEATLRRRLAEEGMTLSELIADVRMLCAMQLLQSTHLPISRIALDVGYESASRFAIRFRRRFGFAPSAIRGHQRSGNEYPETALSKPDV
ncbi:AraC family transcriptional regulator [Phyllobacterium myrsinacearum]|nr:AraC family transcriptional regulator [Phyllobacterium myrsinacearum]